MSKSAADAADSASDAAASSGAPEGLPWTSKTCLSAIDGAVVGNTLGFVIGAFPGMCIGAASGGIAGVLGGGLLMPVMEPAAKAAADAMPGKFVIRANGSANSMIEKICIGPRVDLGKGNKIEEGGERFMDFHAASPSEPAGEPEIHKVEHFQDAVDQQSVQSEASTAVPRQGLRSQKLQLLSRPSNDLNAAKDMLDEAMVRASACGAQGAIAGAEVGGAVLGTALAVPGAVLGSIVGGIMGMCSDVHSRYLEQAQAEQPALAKQEAPSEALTSHEEPAEALAKQEAAPAAPAERNSAA